MHFGGVPMLPAQFCGAWIGRALNVGGPCNRLHSRSRNDAQGWFADLFRHSQIANEGQVVEYAC